MKPPKLGFHNVVIGGMITMLASLEALFIHDAYKNWKERRKQHDKSGSSGKGQ